MAEVEVTSEEIGIIVKLCLIERVSVVILGEKAGKVYTAENGVVQTSEFKLALVPVKLERCGVWALACPGPSPSDRCH